MVTHAANGAGRSVGGAEFGRHSGAAAPFSARRKVDVISLTELHASVGAYSTREFHRSFKKIMVLINVTNDLS